jgi:hypothetical protein
MIFMRKKALLISYLMVVLSYDSFAQTDPNIAARDSLANPDPWSAHFQLTIIDQWHSGFHAKYSGMNSLADTVEPEATSITTTLFLGRKLWKNAAVYFNPELSGGRGLSYAVGVAGALNGETYRIGDPEPVVAIARAYLQQSFALGHSGEKDTLDDGPNQVADVLPAHRITLSAGKFSMSDFYDVNAYSHDPRHQFLNWSLMSNGAWDYPANTKGYTFGLVAELIHPAWALRLSSVAVPVVANHPSMEYVFGKAHSETAEFTKKTKFGSHPGAIRLLFSYTASRAPSYKAGLEAVKTNDTTLLNVIDGTGEGTSYGGHKTGIGLNLEQELTNNIGAFARAGWNDGQYATWAFTEIDRTISAGLSFKGTPWKRPNDVLGVAGVVNGISAAHQAFLKAGGYGFIIGDGNLNYGHEAIAETYYSARLYRAVWLTFDYQFVNNPGYNKDRHGPIHVFAVKGHVEF